MVAAPKPLSMLTTDTPEAQLFSIPSSAAMPPKLAPYPTLVGTAMTGALIKPAITLDANSPLFDHSTTARFDIGPVYSEIDRIEGQLYVRPLAYSIFHELELSGDLDPSIKNQMKTLPVGEQSVWLRATKGTGVAINTNCNPF